MKTTCKEFRLKKICQRDFEEIWNAMMDYEFIGRRSAVPFVFMQRIENKKQVAEAVQDKTSVITAPIVFVHWIAAYKNKKKFGKNAKKTALKDLESTCLAGIKKANELGIASNFTRKINKEQLCKISQKQNKELIPLIKKGAKPETVLAFGYRKE